MVTASEASFTSSASALGQATGFAGSINQQAASTSALPDHTGGTMKNLSQTVIVRAMTAAGTITTLIAVVGAGRKW
jgi:hypothetical protein